MRVNVVCAEPVVNADVQNRIKQLSLNSTTYTFVDKEGHWYGSFDFSNKKTKLYLVNLKATEPIELISSTDIAHLVKDGFQVIDIDENSLISTPQADYFILRLSRPRLCRDAGGLCSHGEDRSFLISVYKGKIHVLDRRFSSYGKYQIINKEDEIGYDVIMANEVGDREKEYPKLISYKFKNGKIIRKLTSLCAAKNDDPMPSDCVNSRSK